MNPTKAQVIYYQRKRERVDMEEHSHSALGTLMNLKNTAMWLVRATTPAQVTFKCPKSTYRFQNLIRRIQGC